VDHDILLDLSDLDDPEPPRFGALAAEDAARRAARSQSRRARLVAGTVLAVAVVAGVAVSGRRLDGPTAGRQVTFGRLARNASVPPFASTSVAPFSAPTARPPADATGQPPEGTTTAPAGLRLTLAVATVTVPSGVSARAVVRFENNRTTAVTLVGRGCGLIRADFFEAGRRAVPGHSCLYFEGKVIAPGAAVQVDTTVEAYMGPRPGTYDAFAVACIQEDGQPPRAASALGSTCIHSDPVVVTVVGP